MANMVISQKPRLSWIINKGLMALLQFMVHRSAQLLLLHRAESLVSRIIFTRKYLMKNLLAGTSEIRIRGSAVG